MQHLATMSAACSELCKEWMRHQQEGSRGGSKCADIPITNYQMAPSKRGAGGGSATHKEANLGSNGKLNFLSKLKQWLPPAHPKSLASQCMSGQPISTCHALTS